MEPQTKKKMTKIISYLKVEKLICPNIKLFLFIVVGVFYFFCSVVGNLCCPKNAPPLNFEVVD